MEVYSIAPNILITIFIKLYVTFTKCHDIRRNISSLELTC